jgi:hypothetical protein
LCLFHQYLLNSVNQRARQVEIRSQKATVDAQKPADRSFPLRLALIVVLLAGTAVAGLAYRFVA